jgi:hypothetical protein
MLLKFDFYDELILSKKYMLFKEDDEDIFTASIAFLFFFFLNIGEPLQGKALWTHLCKVNLGLMHRTLKSFPA